MTTPTGIALQLYSIRAELEAGIGPALEKVAAIGFDKLELFNFVAWSSELRTELPANGLSTPTAHARTIGEDQAPIFETAVALGVDVLIDPYIDPERWTSRDEVLRIADELNATAANAAKHGLQFGYHNHFWEAENVFGDATALEVLAAALDPAVRLEVDAYWAAVGGADVPALLHALGDRVIALHLKDAPTTDDGSLSKDRFDQLPVGEGAIDWTSVLAAAPSAELAVVEFDEYRGNIFDGAAASLAAIRSLTA